MTTIFQTTNIDDSGNAISFTTGGNSLTVAPDVSVSSTGGTAVFITATGNAIDNSGEIYGYDGGINDTLQSTGTGSVFTNEQSGIIVSNYWAISVQDDPYTITNYGRISTTTLESGYGAICTISYGTLSNYGSISGGSEGGYFSLDITVATTTSVVNFGSITAASVALEDDNAYDSDIYTLDNYGSIVGGQSAFQTFRNNGDAEQLTNNGTMQGAIAFGNGAGDFLQNSGSIAGDVTLGSGAGDYVSSTLGTIDGTIACGSGGDVVIAGQTGGLGGRGLRQRRSLRQPDPDGGRRRGADYARWRKGKQLALRRRRLHHLHERRQFRRDLQPDLRRPVGNGRCRRLREQHRQLRRPVERLQERLRRPPGRRRLHVLDRRRQWRADGGLYVRGLP